jgi:hypothetical protein
MLTQFSWDTDKVELPKLCFVLVSIKELQETFYGKEEPEDGWEGIYHQVFCSNVKEDLKEIGISFSWYDPDKTYAEDISAYLQALDEVKTRIKQKIVEMVETI